MKSPAKPVLHPKIRKSKGTQSDSLFQNDPLPAWVYDAETLCFLAVNQAALDELGYSHAEFLGLRLPDVLGDDAAVSDVNEGTSTTADEPTAAGTSIFRKDGSVVMWDLLIRHLNYHGRQAELATMLVAKAQPDIGIYSTASAHSQEILPETQHLAQLGNFDFDVRTDSLHWSAELFSIFGVTPADFRGNIVDFLDRVHPEDRQTVLDTIEQAVAGQKAGICKHRLIRPNGDVRIVEASFTPYFDEKGRHVRTMGTVQDITEKKQAQLALQQVESHYNDLVINTRVMTCTHDLQGNLLSINPWAARALGYETHEMIGRSVQDILLPEARTRFQIYLRQIRRHGSADGIMRLQTASGERRVWEYHSSLRTDETDDPIVRGTGLDVTEQWETEEALRESEARYKVLFEATPIGIALTDLQGNLLAFNDAILEPGCYTRDDIQKIGNVAGFYADPMQRDAVLAMLEKQGYLSKVDINFKRKDGSTYQALLSLRKLEIHGKAHWQVLIEDITQQRAAEQALRNSEILYRELFDNALEGMFRTTPDGRFLSLNRALVHMLGYEAEAELLSLNVQDLYVDPQRRVHNMDKIVEAGELRDFEIHLRRRDGSTLIVLENSRAIHDAAGRVVLYEGTLTDITERMQIEEALRDSESELRALFEAVPDLVLVLDQDGRYLKIVPGHTDMLYAPPENLLGKTITEVFSEPKAAEFLGHIRLALQTGQPVQFEYALLIGSDIKWFSGATARLTDDSVVWVARDITPQKQAEEQVQHRLLELEAVYQNGLSLGKTLDPYDIGRRVIEVLSHGLHWHHAAVRVRRGDTEEVELLAFSKAPGSESSTEKADVLAQKAITRVGQGMAGWVMQHGQLVNSGNLLADRRYHPTFQNMLSGLYVPIWAAGRVLGCISVESEQREGFTRADERLLTTLASQAAAALENARLFAETQQRMSESLALYEFTRDLTAQSDLSILFKTLAERVSSLLSVPGGAVYLYDPHAQNLEVVMSTDDSLPIGTRLELGQGMAGRVAQTREPLVVDDYQAWEHRTSQFPERAWAAVLEVPMLYRGELIGVLGAYQKHSPEAVRQKRSSKFTDEDVRLLSLFAASAAGAVYSTRLFDAERLRRQEAEALRAQAVRSAQRLSGLHAVTNQIARVSQNLEEVYVSIHEAVSRLLPVDGFTIALVDEKAQKIRGAYLFDRNVGRSPAVDILYGESFTGRVIKGGETLLIKDIEAVDYPRVHFGSPDHVRSVLAVPLRVGGQILGTISAQNYLPDVYQPEDQVLLEMLGAQAAIAIQNARLFEETIQRAEEFKALYESAYALPLQQDTASLLQLTVQRATELLHVSQGSLYLYDPDHSELVLASRLGTQSEMEPRSKLGEGAAGRVALSREPLIIENYAEWEGRSEEYEGPAIRAVLEVPMMYGGELIGVLAVHQDGDDPARKFGRSEARLLSLFAAQAAGAIYNVRLLEDTHRRLHELESLAKVGDALAGTLELEPLLENILRTAQQAIPAGEKGSILLRGTGEQSHLHIRAQVGYTDTRLLNEPFDDSKGYAGRAFHEKRPILIRNSLAEYEIPFSQQFAEVNSVQSAIVAPLIVKDQAIGSISLENASHPAAFDEADLRLLMLFASSAAVVIENARLFEETLRRAEEFEVLYEATRDLSSNQQDLSSLLTALVEKAARLMGSHGSGMYLHDPVRGDLEVVVVSAGQEGVGARVKMGEGAAGRVAVTRTALVIDDYQTWDGRRSLLDGTPYRALLQVPMVYGGDLIGVLDVYEYGDSERKFRETDVKLLTLFASQAAGAVHSARLFEETRKKAAQFASLYETARDLADQRNVDQLLGTIVERACKLLQAPMSGIYLYDQARDDLYLAVNLGSGTPLGVRLGIGEGLAGQVAQTRQPMILADYQKWEGRSHQYDGVPLRSVLEVPMLYSGELIGVLAVEEIGKSERKFTQEDSDLLSLFASYAASAVHTARLFEQISHRASEFEALYQTAADLSAQSDLQTLLNTVIQRARDLMGVAGAGVYLYDPQAGDLELAAINDADIKPGIRLALGEGLSGRVAKSKQPLVVNDYQTWEGRSRRYDNLPFTSEIGIPMLYGGQLVGVLNVFNRSDRPQRKAASTFTAQDSNLLELLANSAAGAVYVARLLEQTRRRVEQLSALHAVDTAIGSTTDLRVSLQAVLESVIHQLGVDAADVLLLNPSTLTLQYTAGSGFFASEINRTATSIGSGRAGKVALERQMIEIPDLRAAGAEFTHPEPIGTQRFRAYVGVPLIAKGEVKGVLEVLQCTPMGFDEEHKSLLEILAGQAALAIDNAHLFEGLEKANLELTMAYDATIEGWSQALELRDQETQGHSSRVLELTLRLASVMGLPDRQLRDIRRGVLLHDIGKMGIPDAILHKPGPLTTEEWQIMRQHPQYAYNMLAPIVYLRSALDIPYAHHEKWDGSGYPRGLRAETIPLAARIFSVVDVYDALTSNRPYRGAWSSEKALEYIAEESGKHFDPQIAQAFLTLLRG